MSLLAPLVISLNCSSSAMRPPMAIAIRSSTAWRFQFRRSSLGSIWVSPSAGPRGMMVTLCTGSHCGTSRATRAWPHDSPIEAARPQQRRVEHVGTVGRGDEDHALVGLEAVHLDEQLVEGLLALVVAAAQARAAVPADGVDLVDEDDAGSVLLALLEEVAHAARADAHEHLDEVGPGDAEERHSRLAGDGAGEQRLAGAGRAHQQHALGDAAAELGELLRVLEELDDLFQLVLGLV